MKKIIISLIAALTLSVLGAESIIETFIRFDKTVTEISGVSFRDDFFTKKIIETSLDIVISESINNYNQINARRMYQEVRSKTFFEMFGGYNNFSSYEMLYPSLRALVIVKAKEFLHRDDKTGNELLSMYNDYRDLFTKKLSGLSVEKHKNLASFLQDAKVTFDRVKKGIDKPIEDDYENVWTKTMSLMEKNAGSDVIVAQIQDRSIFKEKESTVKEDYILDFALRRKTEGGDLLLDKYIELITAVLTDLALMKK